LSAPEASMKVVLILPEVSRGWIIEKMAVKLCEGLNAAGARAEVRGQASADAEINHFMMFHEVDPLAGPISTSGVTHVDDVLKVDMIKRQLKHGVRAAICMSTMTLEQLAGYGVERSQLTVALPAHDGLIAPRRIVIGVTSNCYSDGRKREGLLTRLAADERLDDFEFQFFGSGWRDIGAALEAAGAQVRLIEPSDDYLADYAAIRAAVPAFDYYFYPGLDEGSLGVLDALAAGVKTIVTRQGFHLDLPGGVTHGFWDYEEMREIFRAIAAERRRRSDLAATLTWDRYARRHLQIWTALRDTGELPAEDRLGPEPAARPPAAYPMQGYAALMRNPFRRQMALNFWAPGPYRAYLAARRRLGRLARDLRGAPA
jgi:hypothetical protein